MKIAAVFCGFVLFLAGALLPALSFAQTDIYIRGSGRLFPVAVPQLCLQSGETSAVRDIPRILGRDLDISGYFEVLSPESYIEAPGKCTGPDGFAYSDWSVIGAEGLVRGVVTARDGALRVQLYLHDVARQTVVLGKEYEGDSTQIPLMAHRFANEIMRYFTGEAGIFGTQIAFSGKIGRFKELFVMDMDGSNIRQLTNDRSLSVSSSWAPDGKNLVYTSYRSRNPDLFIIDSSTRRATQVTRTPALEVGGKFLRDGLSMLASVAVGRDSDIVQMSTQGAILGKLTTPNGAIDVSPDLSPDGSRVVFCSDRAGGPQIYVMGSGGGNASRISFVNSNYCTSPDWSPKGDRIVFVCRADGGFQLFVANPDGSSAQQLTSAGDNEDPDWSPDGRYIVFSSTFGKGGIPSLALIRNDGSSMRQLTQSRSGDGDPAWNHLLP